MERREAPGLLARARAPRDPHRPQAHLGPGSSACRPADRKAGLREPIVRLPGRLPALHPSPMEREGKQGDGRTWASEQTKSRDSGALAEMNASNCRVRDPDRSRRAGRQRPWIDLDDPTIEPDAVGREAFGERLRRAAIAEPILVAVP